MACSSGAAGRSRPVEVPAQRSLCPGLAKAEQCQDWEVLGVWKTHGLWGQEDLGSNPASAIYQMCDFEH